MQIFTQRLRLLGGLVLAITLAGVAASDDRPRHPAMPGFERFYSDGQADLAQGGLLLLGELNCVSCHQADDAARSLVLPKQAPILDQVGQRVRPEYLRALLSSPHHANPGTTMPDLLARTSESERQEKVEALVHFLALGGQPAESAPIRQSVERGDRLFHSVGCVACHDPRHDGSTSLTTSLPLVDLENKYTIPGLSAFLQDPLAVRPSGRMPHLNLTPDEARDVSSYLLRELKVEPNVTFAYYEGRWDKLPDFDQLKPKETGKCTGFDIHVGQRRDHFGMRFDALVSIPRDGEYRFHLGSDDGSRLLVDGNELIRVDGVHPLTFGSEKIKLVAGVHELTVEYFEQAGDEVLRVEIEGPQLQRQAVEGLLVSSREATTDEPAAFVADESLAAQGKRFFVSLGCASCHQAADVPHGATGVSEPKRLAELQAAGGCLTAEPKAKVPHYALSERQRASLAAAIDLLRQSPPPPAPEHLIRHTMTAFNCYACHQRDDVGGVERPRDEYFKTDQQEMGDEGRIPPHLTGVGGKLQPQWLKHLFDNGAKDRPYMFTRMPRFGIRNVGQLVDALIESDPVPSAPTPTTEIPVRRLKSAGRQLTGSAGFSCIKCHTFAGSKATGIQSISMTTMTRRLRPEWFHEYMLNPQTYRPGTRMPAAWPDGQVLLPGVLDGTADTQIHSLWAYLSDGDKAPVPQGLGSDPEELYAIDGAVIYRNFIEGAGPRAIGVGYPERVNLAFDANNVNLALLWHNAFIDASRHWTGRGQGFQPPLGDNVLRLTSSAPLAVLPSPESGWPGDPPRESGYRFRGYRLGEGQRPTFLYSFNGIDVEDYPEAVSAEPFAPLRRTLTLRGSQPVDNLYYRAAVGDKIEPAGDGWYSINDSWKTRIEAAGSEPLIRTSNGKTELLVPVSLPDRQFQMTQLYAW